VKFLTNIKENKIFASLSLYHAWIFSNIVAALALVFFIAKIFLFYTDQASQAVEQGKQVIISVLTDEILIMATPEKEEEKNETALPTPSDPIPAKKEARLSLVINGLGLDRAATESAIKLSPEITLSFSPYAIEAATLVKDAAEYGHEILLDLPMEASSYPLSDPGPLALVTSAGEVKNSYRLKNSLAAAEGYIGVLAPIDENFTHTLLGILPVINELKSRGLALIYREKPSNVFLKQEANSIGLPIVPDYVVIDEQLSKEAIDEKLQEITEMVNDEGKSVLAIGRPYPITLKRIENWLQKQTETGEIKVSPVSEFTGTPFPTAKNEQQ